MQGFKGDSQIGASVTIADVFKRIGTEQTPIVVFDVKNNLERTTLNLTLSGWKRLWMDGSAHNLQSVCAQSATSTQTNSISHLRTLSWHILFP